MSRRFTKKRVVVAVTVLALAVSGIAAYAYWTTGGSGTGSASTTSAQNVTVNQTNAAISNLYPGGPSKALSGNFDNPNSGPAYVASVTAAVTAVTPAAGNTFASNGKPDCATGDFEITGTSNTPGDVPAGNAKGSWSGLSVDMKDTGANQDNCKNASITITYTANAS